MPRAAWKERNRKQSNVIITSTTIPYRVKAFIILQKWLVAILVNLKLDYRTIDERTIFIEIYCNNNYFRFFRIGQQHQISRLLFDSLNTLWTFAEKTLFLLITNYETFNGCDSWHKNFQGVEVELTSIESIVHVVLSLHFSTYLQRFPSLLCRF